MMDKRIIPVAEDPMAADQKPVLALVGYSGNAFFILGKARQRAREYGWPQEKIEAMTAEAQSGNYDNLLRTMMKYFEVL